MTYTAVFRPDDQGNWLVHIDEEPRVHTYGRTLASARKNIAEALALWLDQDDAPDFTERIDLPDELRAALDDVASMRAQVDKLSSALQVELPRLVTRLLTETSLSMRDAAGVLGLSHQRIAQLVETPSPSGTKRRTSVPTQAPRPNTLSSYGTIKRSPRTGTEVKPGRTKASRKVTS